MEGLHTKVNAVTEKYLDLLERKIDECKNGTVSNEDMYAIHDGIRIINHITQIEQRLNPINNAAPKTK